jgi:hypothetical protein
MSLKRLNVAPNISAVPFSRLIHKKKTCRRGSAVPCVALARSTVYFESNKTRHQRGTEWDANPELFIMEFEVLPFYGASVAGFSPVPRRPPCPGTAP